MHRAGHWAPVPPGDTAEGRDTALREGMALLSGSVGRQRKQAGDLPGGGGRCHNAHPNGALIIAYCRKKVFT